MTPQSLPLGCAPEKCSRGGPAQREGSYHWPLPRDTGRDTIARGGKSTCSYSDIPRASGSTALGWPSGFFGRRSLFCFFCFCGKREHVSGGWPELPGDGGGRVMARFEQANRCQSVVVVVVACCSEGSEVRTGFMAASSSYASRPFWTASRTMSSSTASCARSRTFSTERAQRRTVCCCSRVADCSGPCHFTCVACSAVSCMKWKLSYGS